MVVRYCPNTADYLLADAAPDDVALVDSGERYTYGQLRSAAGRLAAELAALNLPPGSRVGVLGPNSLFWVAAYLAVMKLGHVAVPFSDKLTPDDVRRNAGLVGCAVVFADRRVLRAFAPALSEGSIKVLSDEVLRSGQESCWPPGVPVDPGTDAVLMFTSGTTARPKAVRVTHGNIQANTDSIITFLELRSDDRVLVVLPFFYCYGASLLHTHLRCGGRVVLCNTFVFPEKALDLLEQENCTVFAGVPSSFQLLLRASTFARRALPSLRLIQQAGGKLPPVLIEELLAAKPTAKLFVMYGQTEATARLSYLPPDKLREKPGSVGRGIPGVELRVLDKNGEPVTPGERGEIYATGANISPGYYDDSRGVRREVHAVRASHGRLGRRGRRRLHLHRRSPRRLHKVVGSPRLQPGGGGGCYPDGATRLGGRNRHPGRRSRRGGHALRHGQPGRRGHSRSGPCLLPSAPAEVHGAPLGTDPGRVAAHREREGRQTAASRDGHRGSRQRGDVSVNVTRCRSRDGHGGDVHDEPAQRGRGVRRHGGRSDQGVAGESLLRSPVRRDERAERRRRRLPGARYDSSGDRAWRTPAGP